MPALQFQAPIPIPVQGYRPDLSPRDVGPYALYQAQNWLVRDGVMQNRPGFSATLGAAFAQRPTGYVQYKHTDGATRVVMGTTVGWRNYNSGTNNWDDITGGALTGAAASQQVFRVFQKGTTSYLLGCNTSDTPKKWDGTAGTYSDIAGTPPKSVGMMVLADRVMLLNLKTGGFGATASPVAYDVSNSKDFDTGWGVAQFGLLADTPGPIVGGMEFGNLQGAIYKTDAIVMAVAQGAAAPFGFQWRVTNTAGPSAPNAIVPVIENLHAYLGNDGAVYLFDGINSKSIGYHVQKHVLSTADVFAFDRSFGFWDFERQELWFFYPEVGSIECNVALVVNLSTGTFESTAKSGALWPMRFSPTAIKPVAGAKLRIAASITWDGVSGGWQDQAKTWSQFDTQLRRTVLGDLTTGQNFTDQSYTGDGPPVNGIPEPVTGYFETGLSDLSSPGSSIAMRWKTVSDVDHFIQGGPGFGLIPDLTGLGPGTAGFTVQPLTMKVGYSDFGETRALSPGQTFADITTPQQYIFGARITARLISCRLEASMSGPIRWYGAEAGIAVRGSK
jgi:hypothetical protein